MTTNGSQLARFADDLYAAGVRRVNISLDTLEETKFADVTRWGRLEQVLRGVDAAQRAGLRVKINAVALKGFNEEELPAITAWCADRDMDLTWIEVMPMGDIGNENRIGQYWSLKDVRTKYAETYTVTDLAERTEATRARRERAQIEAQQAVIMEREDRVFLAFVLLLVAFGLGQWALTLWQQDAGERDEKRLRIVGGATAVVVLIALAAYLTRPGLDEIDRRVAASMQEGADGSDAEPGEAKDLALLCTLVPERSRITSADTQDVEFDWTADGCVNERTQYGFAGGSWSRVFVPNDEAAVSVNSFDPDRRIFRSERYLLPRSEMSEAREARAKFEAPQCGSEGAASRLGELQSEVLGKLPQQANERLVYECKARN